MSDNESTMEINFRLDAEGRTIRQIPDNIDGGQDDTSQAAKPTTTTTSTTNNHTPADCCMDYDTKVAFISNLIFPQQSDDLLDEMLLDCEIADCGFMPRTFWIPAHAQPRFRLEYLALAIFRHHVKCSDYDPETSGAEWWVQLRPSPEKSGRYALHDTQNPNNNNSNNENAIDDQNNIDTTDMGKTGISFHWDKDEELRLLTDGTIHLHPHISTVTYLTDLGCPTLVLNFRVDPFTGKWMEPTTTMHPQGFVSWPKQGKHLSFDGRFLHAAPPDLMEDGAFEQQCQVIIDNNTTFEGEDVQQQQQEEAKQRRRRRRATFLVNIWLNYRPTQVDPFPDSMIDKMSRDAHDNWDFAPMKQDVDQVIRMGTGSDSGHPQEVDPTTAAASQTTTCRTPTRMIWPMGDCNSHETIEVDLPLQDIRGARHYGGNVRLEWNTGKCFNGEATSSDDLSGVKPGIGLYRRCVGEQPTKLDWIAPIMEPNVEDIAEPSNHQGKRKRQPIA